MRTSVLSICLFASLSAVGCGTGEPVTFFESSELQVDVGPVDSDIDLSFQTTESGLRYRILRHANGPKPTADDRVSVHYRGWVDSGAEFDSSYKTGVPSSFGLRGVIRAWTEGVQLVNSGGMIELWVPPELGYGAKGAGGLIGPNATLHFVVELVKIEEQEEQEPWQLPES